MKPGAVILVSGPLDPADWWNHEGRSPNRLGFPVITPVDACYAPPFSVAWLASVAQHLQLTAPADPLVVVGHGSAGPLLPALARTQRAGGRHIAGYVFVDATLPRPGPTSHLDLLKAAASDEERLAHEHLHAPGGMWPAPVDPEGPLPGEVRGAEPHAAPEPPQELPRGVPPARPRDHQFWSETLPPAIDWPDAPCVYVRTGRPAPGCGDVDFWARSARSRDWPVIEETDPLQGVRASLDLLPG